MRHIKILSITLGVVLALGTASCLEEEKQPETKADTGTANTPDTGGTVNTPDTGGTVNTPDTGTVNKGDTGASGPNENTNELCSDGIDNDGNKFTDCADFSCCRYGVPATGITVCPAGTCGGGDKGDAGTSTRPDSGVVKPTLDEVEVTIADVRTKTADYSDLSVFPGVHKKIVILKDVVVVGTYTHTGGEDKGVVNVYLQDVGGGANSGINLRYTPPTGTNAVVAGDKVTVKGCVQDYFGILAVMWCVDSKNTQATVTTNGTATVPAPSAFAASTLGKESTTHDDQRGQQVKVSDALTLVTKTVPECTKDGTSFCFELKDAADKRVLMKTGFVFSKCSADLNGPFPALVGVWDNFQSQSDANKTLRVVTPMNCESLK